MMINKVGLIGYGYWGQKLARCFTRIGVLERVWDINNLPRPEEGLIVASSLEDLLESVDGVAIATPPETHFELALMAIDQGKHVFVEKPLATNSHDVWKLVSTALEKNVKLQTGYIYMYNSGLMNIPRPERPFDLRLQFLNEGGPPSSATRDLLHAAMPHAASIILHFFPDFNYTIEDADVFSNNVHLSLAARLRDKSSIFVNIGDYASIKTRTVQVIKDNHVRSFDAASPHEHHSFAISDKIIETKHIDGRALEPLWLECQEFVYGPIAVDKISLPVSLILDMVEAWGFLRYRRANDTSNRP